MAAVIVRACEGGGLERLDLDRNSELFLQLARERRLRPLSFLDLPAGEFPKAGHGPSGRALLEQHPALAVHQRHSHHRECRNFLQIRGQWKDSVNSTHISTSGLGGMPDVGIRPMRLFFAKLIRDSKAASAVEYALICALIVLAMMAGVTAVAGRTTTMWNDVSNNVTEHVR